MSGLSRIISIKLADNPLSSARSRHVGVRLHFLRELRVKKIDIQFVASAMDREPISREI